MVMGQVWGISKRKFGREWGKRIWLFDALIWMVMAYERGDLGMERERKWKGCRKDI